MRPKAKSRGRLSFTRELLQELLELPEEVELIGPVEYDPKRDCFLFSVRSEEPVTGYTLLHIEGQEIVKQSYQLKK